MSIQDDLIAAPRVPLRYLVTFNPRPRKSLSDESCYLPMEAISEFGKVDTSRTRPTSEMAQGYSYLEDGDVAYAKVTPCFENGKGLLADGLPGAHAYATTEITVMRPGPKLDARYLAWVLQSDGFRSPGESHMSGAGGLKRVPDAYAAQFRIPHPSGAQQRAIADFLDRETAQIDAFIAKNEQLITLLTERRAAIASRAMAMTFPEVAVRHLVRLIQTGPFGSQIHTDDYISGGWPLINPMHMIDGRAVPSSDVAVSDQKAEELRRHRLREGDLVVARRGELGRSALIGETDHGFLCGTGSMLVRPVPSIVMPRYLQLAIGSERSRATLTERSVGSTMDNLNAGALSSLRVPLPPLEAQRAILAQVDQGNGRIDAAMEAAKRSNRLARERRAALISAAVTGKVDVGVSA